MSALTWLKFLPAREDVPEELPTEVGGEISALSTVLFELSEELKHPVHALSLKEMGVQDINPKVQEAGMELLRHVNDKLMWLISEVSDLPEGEEGEQDQGEVQNRVDAPEDPDVMSEHVPAPRAVALPWRPRRST